MQEYYFGRGLRTSFKLGTLLATVLTLLSADRASAQDGPGKYITEASARLIKLVNNAHANGYRLQNNSFSLGGGWLTQGQNNWVALYTITLDAGKEYRFMAAGDYDAKDVDLQVLDPSNNVVAQDVGVEPEAIVNYRANTTGRYLVRIRL